MNNDKSQVPLWANSARIDVKSMRQDLMSIRAEGQADVEQGLQTIRLTDGLLQELDYLDRTLGQALPTQVWNDELVSASGIQLAGTAQVTQRATHELAGLYVSHGQHKHERHVQLVSALYSTATTSGSMTFMGAQIERRIEAISPAYTPVIQSCPPVPTGGRERLLEELAERLSGLDRKYVLMLRGSEESLTANHPDSLGQAAHSMRDLFDRLVKDLAPTNVVKAQPWFSQRHVTDQGVSTAARIRYLLYGSGQALTDSEILQLDASAESAKTALRLVIARCHDHDPELRKAEVETAIDLTRYWLSQILERYLSGRSLRAGA